MNIVILGAPGAGKGTQAVRISQDFGIPKISTGDILRDNVTKDTDLGKKAEEYMNEGKLVPDDIIIELVSNRLEADDCKEGFILDGFPRTLAQAEALQTVLANQDKSLDVALYVEVGEKELIRRLGGRRTCLGCKEVYHIEFSPPDQEDVCDKCGGGLQKRDDDEEEAVKTRLEVYLKSTAPAISYYGQKAILEVVDGEKSPEDVYQEVKEALEVLKV